MREALAVLVVLASLAPTVHAQGAPATPPLVTASLDAFPSPAEPLRAPVEARLHANVSCALAAQGTQGVQVSLALVDKPAWASVVVSPASVMAPLSKCADGWIPVDAAVEAVVGDTAPAFRPAPVVVRVRAEGQAGPEDATAATNLTAGFHSILDVSLIQSVARPAAGQDAVYPVRISNLGNDEVDVTFTVVSDEGAQVTLPPTLHLGSKQQGDNVTSQLVEVRARASGGGPRSVTVHVTSTEARGAQAAGDDATFSVILSPQRSLLPSGLPGAPALVLGLAAAALLVRRRPRSVP